VNGKDLKPYKIAVLGLHPVQYQASFYRALHNNKAIMETVYYLDDLSLHEYFCEEFSTNIKWDQPLMDGYRSIFLKNISWNKDSMLFGRINPGIITVLLRGRYDAVIITGYTTLTALIALLVAKLSGVKVLFRVEADLNNQSQGLKSVLKHLFLPTLFKLCNAVMFSCKKNRDYFCHFGVPDQKLFPILSSVENSSFQEKRKALLDKKRLRRKLGIPEEPVVVLYVGRLTERKRPHDLLAAFQNCLEVARDTVLVVVGDGPLRNSMEEQANKKYAGKVIFAGFKNLSQTPEYYAASDIFVLPSEYDPTPKVVNEAMNFSLPVIVSTGVGTANDLVQHDVNGFVFNKGDVETLGTYLLKLMADTKLRRSMGKAALDTVSDWSPEKNVEGVISALTYCSLR